MDLSSDGIPDPQDWFSGPARGVLAGRGLHEGAVDGFARRRGIPQQQLLAQVHDHDDQLLLVHHPATTTLALPRA